MSKDNKEPFFNQERQEKALEWLKEKLQNKKCECCGNNNWNIADFIVTSPRFEDGMVLGGKMMPHVASTCSNCGNTKFFNAVMMGIVDGR